MTFILKVYEFFNGAIAHRADIGDGYQVEEHIAQYGIENEQGEPLVQIRFDDKRKRVVLIFNDDRPAKSDRRHER